MFGLVDSIAGPTIAPQLPYAIATVVHLDGTPSHPSTLVTYAGKTKFGCLRYARGLAEEAGHTAILEDAKEKRR